MKNEQKINHEEHEKTAICLFSARKCKQYNTTQVKNTHCCFKVNLISQCLSFLISKMRITVLQRDIVRLE
jgi:hypothetical protein